MQVTSVESGNPILTTFQALPLIFDKNNPALVPAKILSPLNANANTSVPDKPAFTADQ